MYRLNFNTVCSLIAFCFSVPSHAVSLNIGYAIYDQDVPLFSRNDQLSMRGMSINLAHQFNDKWSASLYSQQADDEQNKEQSDWGAEAEQTNYSATVNYQLTDYYISLSYSDMEFDLRSLEVVDLSTNVIKERFVYLEEIDSTAIALNVSREIDFNNYWITIDAGVSSIEQTASYGSRLVAFRGGNQFSSAELNEQDNHSWLASMSLSITSIWAWKDIGIVPSISANYSSVVAGDNSYLINSVNGGASRAQNQRVQSEGQEPATGNDIFVLATSITTLVNDNLSFDLSYNRQFGDSSSDGYFAAGVGWLF